MAWGAHVRLKQGTFQVDKVAQGQYLLSYALMALQDMVAIHQGGFRAPGWVHAILLGRCWHKESEHWHFPCVPQSSAHNIAWQSRLHPCTGHSVQTA